MDLEQVNMQPAENSGDVDERSTPPQASPISAQASLACGVGGHLLAAAPRLVALAGARQHTASPKFPLWISQPAAPLALPGEGLSLMHIPAIHMTASTMLLVHRMSCKLD